MSSDQESPATMDDIHSELVSVRWYLGLLCVLVVLILALVGLVVFGVFEVTVTVSR